MMRVSVCLVLFMMAVPSLNAPQAKTVVPLKVRGDKSLVAVKVGDVTIPEVLLDTGFAFDGVLIYNPDYRDSLDLSGAVEVQVPGAGSGQASKALMLDSASFRLGDLELTNQRVIVLLGDAFRGFPSSGIVGYSIFGHYVTQLDFDAGALTLFGPAEARIDSSWTALPLYFKKNSVPWMDISVVIRTGRPTTLSAYIDLASREPVELLQKPDMKVGLPERTTDAHLGTGLSGDVSGKTGRISRLFIGPFELKNVNATFPLARVRSRQENADAILGSGSLRRFNLIFDYQNRRLYLKPNRSFGETS